MPRPAKKAAGQQVPPPVAAAPPQQTMMPATHPQGMSPHGVHMQHFQQMPVMQQQQQHQPQPQFQQLQQQLQQHQQPLVVPAHGRVIDYDSFMKVRESAIGRLNTIVDLLRSFTTEYVRQTNVLLGEPTNEAVGDLLANFDQAAAQLILPVHTELVPPAEEKKERKKRTLDPNAPKRPLTRYFLYMQHARSIIANDLGADAPKGAVQEEGRRRWDQMSPGEKEGWNQAYQYNLRLYNARVHSYKAGNLNAKEWNDPTALAYADENGIPMPAFKEADVSVDNAAANDHDAIAQQLQQVAAAQIPDLHHEPELDSKTPKKGAARKRKSEVAESEVPQTATPTSPEKKRRRASGKPADLLGQPEEPKKSGRKKSKS